MKTKNIIYIIIGFIIAFALLKQCEGDVKTKVETETIIKWKTDTIIKTEIKELEKKVYVEKIKTLKGKDSIVYKDKPSETTITAKQYEVKLESNQATANLLITSETAPLDVQGFIEYPEKETITTITNAKNASGLFLYGKTAINTFETAEVGLMFQFKNKVGVMTGINYNLVTKQPNLEVGFLIKL